MNIQSKRKTAPSVGMDNVPAAKKPEYSGKEITALPNEIIVKILTNLNARDLFPCQLVSKSWKGLVDTLPILPIAFYRHCHPVTPEPSPFTTDESRYRATLDWLTGFNEQGRDRAEQLGQLFKNGYQYFPERLFFTVSRTLVETPLFDCKRVCTVRSLPVGCRIRFSLDQQQLVFAPFGKRNKKPVIYKYVAGQWERSKPLPHSAQVGRADFSPDNQYLVTVCNNDTAHVWKSVGQRWQIQTTLPHQYDVSGPCLPPFSYDGHYLVTALKRTTQVNHCVGGQWQKQCTLVNDWFVRYVRFHPCKYIFAAMLDYGYIKIWRLVGELWMHQTTLHDPPSTESIYFSPNGNRLLAATGYLPFGMECVVWNGADGSWCKEGRIPLSDQLFKARFTAKGDHLVTVCTRSITLWRFLANTWQKVALPRADDLGCASFSPAGDRLMTVSRDHTTIRLWKDVDGQWQEVATLPRAVAMVNLFYRRVMDACFSPHGCHVITAYDDKTAKIWGIFAGQWQEKATLSFCDQLKSACFSRSGYHILTVAGYTASLWSLKDKGHDHMLEANTKTAGQGTQP